MIHLDFETQCLLELADVGADRYSQEAEIICLAYAFDDEAVQLWHPQLPAPKKLLERVSSGEQIVAYNYSFEFLIWNNVCVPKYGFPSVTERQFRCPMNQAYAMSLPGKLENLAPALGIEERKDQSGKRVMMQLAKPNPDGRLWRFEDSPEKFEKVYNYCIQDVNVEREVDRRLMQLSPFEREVLSMDFWINRRGIKIDVRAAKIAQEIAFLEEIRLNDELRAVTDGAVTTYTATSTLAKWVRSHGIGVDGVSKNHIIELLLMKDLPPAIRKALVLRAEAAKSSVKKLAQMVGGTENGRLKGLFQYHGAGTGRFAGRRVQPQNFPRPSIKQKEIDTVFEILLGAGVPKMKADRIRFEFGRVLSTLSECLRGFMIADEGKFLLGCDASSIESRVLAWLAGQESKLEVHRKGGDVYVYNAADIYSISPSSVTEEQRFIGKVSELSLGYQGGERAFVKMGLNYGKKISEAMAASIKDAWRAANPMIVKFWYELEDAACRAIANPGKTFWVNGKIAYLCKGSFLLCQLPSKRVIVYPYPELKFIKTPWGAMKQSMIYKAEDGVTKKFEEQIAYGGLLAENVTQAVARDVLVQHMMTLQSLGHEIVLHVHDEIVLECTDLEVKEVERIMSTPPAWAKGLPLAAKGWKGKRYRK